MHRQPKGLLAKLNEIFADKVAAQHHALQLGAPVRTPEERLARFQAFAAMTGGKGFRQPAQPKRHKNPGLPRSLRRKHNQFGMRP